MTMLDTLLHLETPLFLWLNQQHAAFSDGFMWLVTNKWTWLPILLLLTVLIFYKTSWRQAVFLVIAIILCVTLADQLSDAVLKPYFARLRPSHHPHFREIVHLVHGYRGGQYGFVSSHAANSFAIAVFLHKAMPTRLLSVTVFLWALLSSYSRIYLGVHFLSDVIFGGLLGAGVGYVVYQIYVWARMQVLDKHQAKATFVHVRYVNMFALTWLVYLLGIALWAMA